MIDRLDQDIKEAMKAGEKQRLAALRYLKSMLIENRTSKSPISELDVAIKHVKKLRDSLELYPAENPMREQIAQEIRDLEPYLPKAMTEDEVKDLIQKIKTTQSAPQMGSIMKELSPQIKGRFDGKRATELIKEALA